MPPSTLKILFFTLFWLPLLLLRALIIHMQLLCRESVFSLSGYFKNHFSLGHCNFMTVGLSMVFSLFKLVGKHFPFSYRYLLTVLENSHLLSYPMMPHFQFSLFPSYSLIRHIIIILTSQYFSFSLCALFWVMYSYYLFQFMNSFFS